MVSMRQPREPARFVQSGTFRRYECRPRHAPLGLEHRQQAIRHSRPGVPLGVRGGLAAEALAQRVILQ